MNRRRVVSSKARGRGKGNNNGDEGTTKEEYNKSVSKSGRNTLLHSRIVWLVLGICFAVVLWTGAHNGYLPFSAKPSLGWTEVPGSTYIPRMLQLKSNHKNEAILLSKIRRLPIQWNLPDASRENEYWQDDGVHDLKMPDDLRTRETCEYTADWQFAYHPSCNSIHETALNDLGSKDGYEIELVNNGAFRDVWRIREFDGVYRVMKTLRLIPKRKFDQRNFDRHRRDALAFEQLAPSPHVVDIYGHCSNSAVFDLCGGGDLFQVRPLAHPSESSDEEEESKPPIPMPTSKRLLEVAIVVAKSVADAHNMDDEGRPTIAHTDIKPDQWILGSDGNFRLNDFNRARFLSWDVAAEEVCPFTVGKNPGMWRSPEEYNYADQTEKGDVWSMGNVLFFLLTGEIPNEAMDYSDAIKHVARGGKPKVNDEAIANTSDPYTLALMTATKACHVVDPKRRPGAKEIAEMMEKAKLAIG